MPDVLELVEELFGSYLKLNLRKFSSFSLSNWKDYHFDYEGSFLIGESEDGIGLYGVKIGSGTKIVSLIAGCHADEPVGPLHLNILMKFLEEFREEEIIQKFLKTYQLWIIPDANPDGAIINDKWWRRDYLNSSNLSSYLKYRVRELPGRDVEFGFPSMRPENKAISDWWIMNSQGLKETDSKVITHVSLHGMGFSGGPWFLLEKSWDDQGKLNLLKKTLSKDVKVQKLVPHDMERLGEKGFYRLGEGFCSRPDSVSMKNHFEMLGDFEMAGKFEQSSMEYIRSLFGDVFTCVSEMPLFILPDVGREIGPPDLASALWKTRMSQWELELSLDSNEKDVNLSADNLGLKPMSVNLQP